MAGPLLRVLILLKPNKYHRMQIAARYRIIDLLKQIADELHLSVDQLLDVSIYRRGAADRSVLYPLYGNTSSTFDQLGLASHEELFIDLSKLPSNEQLNSIEFDQSTASKGAIANEITTNNLSVHPPKKTLLGQLIRYPVPPDNSCLFSSIYFVFHSGQLDPSATKHLRNLVASKIEADPQTYSEAILGRPNSEYSKWIRRGKRRFSSSIELISIDFRWFLGRRYRNRDSDGRISNRNLCDQHGMWRSNRSFRWRSTVSLPRLSSLQWFTLRSG